jgi:hypothetical protein
MVIADFNVVCVTILKPKADPPLIVDGYRLLALAITFKRMQPVARWISQVVKLRRKIHVLKLTCCSRRNIRRKSLGFTRLIKLFREPISEGLDHTDKCNVSRDRSQCRRERLACRLTTKLSGKGKLAWFLRQQKA